MNGADPRDEGSWLDDMPRPRPRGDAAARLGEAVDAAVAELRNRNGTAYAADEDARARVRRIGVER